MYEYIKFVRELFCARTDVNINPPRYFYLFIYIQSPTALTSQDHTIHCRQYASHADVNPRVERIRRRPDCPMVITRSMTPDDVIQPSTRLSDANPRVERIRSRIEGANTLTQNHKHSGRCHTDVGYAQPSDSCRTSGRCVFDIK